MAKRNSEPEDAGEDEDLDLTVSFHTRISAEAKDMIRRRARQDGVKPSTWGRQQIYRALGLIRSA